MTAVDHETGRDIINPYIAINHPKKDLRVFLNTSSFESCQDCLISPFDFDRLNRKDAPKLYMVHAVVGEYNDYIHTVSLCRPARSESLLGYLDEEVMRRNLPRTFKTLTS